MKNEYVIVFKVLIIHNEPRSSYFLGGIFLDGITTTEKSSGFFRTQDGEENNHN
jgi:hypothetical protein